MIAAGLLARKAVERGLQTKPWVKTSLAPGSKVVTDYLVKAGLQTYLDALGFNLVGYGCTTCIGNSGPLPDDIAAEVRERHLVVCAVLSGNRNFEGRIQQDVATTWSPLWSSRTRGIDERPVATDALEPTGPASPFNSSPISAQRT